MQVTETLSQGLRREFKVVLPATELEQRLTSELSTLKDRVRLNGFRPGKVPVGHLRGQLPAVSPPPPPCCVRTWSGRQVWRRRLPTLGP